MTGRELLLAVSLLLLDLRYNDPFQPLNDLNKTVVFPGNKADIFR